MAGYVSEGWRRPLLAQQRDLNGGMYTLSTRVVQRGTTVALWLHCVALLGQ